jgi:DNA-binding transcriptional MerR regulator/effector-binding domain-containing protein
MFAIGAFSRLCGVSAKALRAYDAAGLFRPAWVDRSSGYRFYSPAQLPEIRRIATLRDMGMGLSEIGSAVAGGDLPAALARRRAELDREARAVERRLALLDIRVASEATVGLASDIVLRSIGREPVGTLDLAAVAGGDPEAGFDELEAFVRDAGIRAHRPPGMLVGRREVIYVPARRSFAPTPRIGFRVLPATRAATILHRGGYDGLGRARLALRGWVRAAGFKVAGDLRILYLQFGADAGLRIPRPWVVEEPEDFLTELQLPVDEDSRGAPRSDSAGRHRARG